MWPNPQLPVDLVTFTEEILHGKLLFLCGEICAINPCKGNITVIKKNSQLIGFHMTQKLVLNEIMRFEKLSLGCWKSLYEKSHSMPENQLEFNTLIYICFSIFR